MKIAVIAPCAPCLVRVIRQLSLGVLVLNDEPREPITSLAELVQQLATVKRIIPDFIFVPDTPETGVSWTSPTPMPAGCDGPASHLRKERDYG